MVAACEDFSRVTGCEESHKCRFVLLEAAGKVDREITFSTDRRKN